MLRSFIALSASSALAFLAVVQAQAFCGEKITVNGTFSAFQVVYYDNYTVVTTSSLGQSKSYALYCGDTAPVNTGVTGGVFKVPLKAVAVGGTSISSYLELSGNGGAIVALERPGDVVSPCLQQRVQSKTIESLIYAVGQYDKYDAGFRDVRPSEQPLKDIWIPQLDSVHPLERIEYITVISLFFGNGSHGELIYNLIKGAFITLSADMNRIPLESRKRIAWVYYSFTESKWTLRNNEFTRGIITAAGGTPFPLTGDVPDRKQLSATEIKTLLLNSQIVIDETSFAGQPGIPIQKWRELAGFASTSELPVLEKKNVFSLDNTMSVEGSNDSKYRLPARPDLLLKDLIYVQYPLYDPSYNLTFLNKGFSYGEPPRIKLSAADCPTTTYNKEESIKYVTPNSAFTGDGTTPPAAIGGGIYGNGGPDSDPSKAGSSNNVGIIVTVVCVAAVLITGFGFIFFKWTRRAKEDRFIELEEEMNNEIPLR